MASFHSGPGQHAVTVSSGSSVHSVVDISSSSDSDEATSRPPARRVARRRRPSSPVVRSRGAASTDTGGGDAASHPRSAARRRRRSSPSVRSPVATSTDTGGGGGGDATSRPRSAARRRRPSSPSSAGAVSVGSSDRRAGDEATSRRKYNKWSHEDERQVIDAMGRLRKANNGEIPSVSLILKEVLRKRAFERRGLKARELSSKIYWLKRKFAVSEDKAAANYGKLMRKTKHREKMLHKMSQEHELWPDVDADDGAAYLEARGIPRRPRRRKI